MIHKVFPKAKFLMIEGNDACKNLLSDSNFKGFASVEIALVGKEAANVTYYKRPASACADSTGNGIFKENTNYFAAAVKETRMLKTIDSIVSQSNLGAVQFMKLDIQGAEVPALKGATNVLQNVDLLFTEAPVANYNLNAPGFFKLHETINHLGFDIYDIVDLARGDVLIQFDVLWMKRTSPLWNVSCSGYPARKYANPNAEKI